MQQTQVWSNRPNLNANEVSKLEKDGLEVFKDLETMCTLPFETVPKSYYMYLKYAGLTVQKPQKAGLFMFRVKIPGGVLTSEQAQCLVWLAETYGHNILDLTTRQSIQCHNVPFHALTTIFKRLYEVGLTSSETEGDTPRNIVGNPMAGIDPQELFDTSSIVQEVNDYLQDNLEFSNLPRKFKISISANILNAANAQIHDLSFTPASKCIKGERIFGFHVYIGGGLGAVPMLAKRLNLFVKQSQVLTVTKAVLTLYRDFGYREARNKARLKFLLEDWGVDRFEQSLLQITGPLYKAGRNEMRGWNYGMAQGLQQQKQSGKYTLGISVPTGRIKASDLAEFAEITNTYGSGKLRIDHLQNLMLPDIPESQLQHIQEEPLVQKFGLLSHRFSDCGMCCTGNEFCNMALTNTKDITKELLAYLDKHIDFDVPVRIVINGCPNNCGHRSIADIAYLGTRIKDESGNQIEAYSMGLGGSLEQEGAFAKNFTVKVPGTKLAQFTLEFLRFVKKHKRAREGFYHFINRLDIDALQQQVDAIYLQCGLLKSD